MAEHPLKRRNLGQPPTMPASSNQGHPPQSSPIPTSVPKFWFADEPFPPGRYVLIIVPHTTSAIRAEFQNALPPPRGPTFVVSHLGDGNPDVLKESDIENNLRTVQQRLDTMEWNRPSATILASFHPHPLHEKIMEGHLSTTLLEPSVFAAMQRGEYFGIITTNEQFKGTIENKIREITNGSKAFRGVYFRPGF